MNVEESLQDYVLGRLPARDLARVATQFLLDGTDTMEMAVAAMPDTTDPREIRELFTAALASVGRALPTGEDAAQVWLVRQARRAVTGEISIHETARNISEVFGWPSDADRLPQPY